LNTLRHATHHAQEPSIRPMAQSTSSAQDR
jgi:hypothetical protein